VATSHQEQAFQLLEEATSAASGGPLEHRLLAALSWVNISIEWSHPSELDAFCTSLELLQVLISIGSSLESVHYRLTSTVELKQTQHLAVDAAACAIREGRIEMALELLEQGRSLLLTQAGRYRTPVDDLEDTLADEFKAISAKMEASAMTTRLQNVDRSSNPTTQDGVAMYVQRLYFAMPSNRRITLVVIRNYWSIGHELLRRYAACRGLDRFYCLPRSQPFKWLQ
jgi:hypothetical protein